jgi:elongation factor Ts
MSDNGITAAQVKALRDETGAGMMDCKRALEGAGGDMDEAREILMKKGLAKAGDRSDRANDQGAVALATADNAAAVVELKAETDFSAKSDDFVALVVEMADAVLADGEEAVAAFSEKLDQLKVTKKENIEVGTVARVEAGEGAILDTYLHSQDGRGTNAVVVETKGLSQEDAHQLALHVGFAKPMGLTRDQVPADEVDKARHEFEEVTRAEGKPDQAVPKIVEGRLNAWFGDRVLLDQGLLGEKKPKIHEFVGDGEIVRYVQAYIGG